MSRTIDDLREIAGDVEADVRLAIEDFLEGAEADIEAYAKRITTDMLLATQLGKPELIPSLVNQLKMVAELQRIKAVQTQWDTFGKVLTGIFRILFRVLQ